MHDKASNYVSHFQFSSLLQPTKIKPNVIPLAIFSFGHEKQLYFCKGHEKHYSHKEAATAMNEEIDDTRNE